MFMQNPLKTGREPHPLPGSDKRIQCITHSNWWQFTVTLKLQDLLNLDPDCSFEENFFHFRSKVKDLEQFLLPALNRAFAGAPTLQAQLRVLELYQGISRRDSIRVCLWV